MPNLKILYAASEIAPFVTTSSVAPFFRKLTQAMQHKVDLRILVPKFGTINTRKYNLHEVVRLSNIDIPIGEDLQTISVRVTSIQGIRLQVYFMDNELYFSRKHVFRDAASNFFEDNDERLIFMCKSILETIKHLNWTPDIIHCHDWITSLVPYYLQQSAATDPTLKDIKVIFNLYNTAFPETLHADFVQKAGIADIAQSYPSIGFNELMQIGAEYADVVAHSETTPLPETLTERITKDIRCINDDDEGIAQYHQIYQTLHSPV